MAIFGATLIFLVSPRLFLRFIVSVYQVYPRLRREEFYLRLCEKSSAAAGGRRLFTQLYILFGLACNLCAHTRAQIAG